MTQTTKTTTPAKASARLAAPLALGLVLAAGTAAVPATASPHLTPAPSTRPAAVKRVVLTNADDGRAVALALGDDLEVRLTGSRSQGLNYTWRVPQSSDPSNLQRATGGTTPTGSATAVFRAQHPGTATITSARACRPDPGRVCPMVVAPWKVTVEVK
ncbi:hypothetical protein [Streptomyces sp. NPDC001205]